MKILYFTSLYFFDFSNTLFFFLNRYSLHQHFYQEEDFLAAHHWGHAILPLQSMTTLVRVCSVSPTLEMNFSLRFAIEKIVNKPENILVTVRL